MITTVLIIGGVLAVGFSAALILVLVKSAKIAEDAITLRSLCPACLGAGPHLLKDPMAGETFMSVQEACPVCGGMGVVGVEIQTGPDQGACCCGIFLPRPRMRPQLPRHFHGRRHRHHDQAH